MRWIVLLALAGCSPSTAGAPDLGARDFAAAPPDLLSYDFAGAPAAVDWSRQALYLVLVDRFANGSTANDALGLPDCLDAANPQKFHGGDFAGLTQRLSYLEELGVSAVWITPAYQQAFRAPVNNETRCGYHGYWADFTDPDDGAVEPRLGSAAELTALVEALHQKQMRFVLDMVVNHAGDGARIAQQHADWFHDPDACMTLGDPAIYCPYRRGIHDFAQEKPEVAAWLDAMSAGWVRRFAIDGIRMDTAKYVPPSYFRDSWHPAVRAARPLFTVGEVFDGDAAVLQRYLDAGFDSVFNFPLKFALTDAFAKEQSVDKIADVITQERALLGEARLRGLVSFLDNHDTMRFASEAGAVPGAEAQRRLHLALIALFTLPGIPQLYVGDELALLGGNDPDNRRDMPSWAWSASSRARAHAEAAGDPAQTFSLTQRLIMLRRTENALADGDYKELWRQNGAGNPNLLVFFRSAANSSIVAVLNNGAQPASARVPSTLGAGVVLEELARAGAPSTLVVSEGAIGAALASKAGGVYRPRASGCEVTFRVRAPDAPAIVVAGSTPELGEWDLARAVHMTKGACDASGCAWSATLRYLPFGQSMELKFVRGGAWENGANRSFTAPAAPSADYDGVALH